VIKTILLIVLALTLGPAPIVRAATVPSIGEVLQPSRVDSVPRPEPAALPANWWRYFEVKDKELDRRIQETKQRLKPLLEELPNETAATARPLVAAIQNNLDALAEIRGQPNPDPPPPLAYAQSYTIEQLMNIVRRLLSERVGLQSERNEVASAEKAIAIARQGVDTQLAAYLNLAPTDPERVLRGLEMMADRSAVAVAEEELRLSKAELKVHETLVAQLANEQDVAVERLVATQTDLERLAAQIMQAQTMLHQAQERVTEEQTTALNVAADRVKRMNLPYQQQRVVNAKARAAMAMVRLIRLQAERQLAALLMGTPAMDTRALREQLADWDTGLADLRQEVTVWISASQQERDRAAEAMATGATVSGGAVPLFSMLYGDRLALAQQTMATLQTLNDSIAQVEVLLQVVDKELARQLGELRDWLAWGEFVLQQLWERTIGWASQSLFKIGDTPVTVLGLLRVGFILVIAWLISHWFRRVLARFGKGHKEVVTQSALFTIGRLFHYGIITLGFIIGLASIGIDFTNFALVAGAIGIGIGFGLQSIVSNFVSGLILLFERTLKVGDFVELGSGVAGEVRAINVRSTLISTNDNVEIVVPNSKFINDNVINWTLLEAYCRIHISFKVAYGTDGDLVTQAGLEAADKVPYTLKERQASVWLVDFGDSSLDYELVVWVNAEAVKRPGAVHAAYKREIALALRKYGIEIPVSQLDLRLRNGFKEGLQPDSGAPRDKEGS